MTATSYLRAVVACAVTALFLCLYVYSYTTHDSSMTGTITVIRSHTVDQELQYSKEPEDDHGVSRRTSTAVQSPSSVEHAPSPPHHPSTPHSYTTNESSTTATKIDQELQYSKEPEDDHDVSRRTSTAVPSPSSAEHAPSPHHYLSTPPRTTYASIAHYPSTLPHSAPVAHHSSVPTSIASLVHHPSTPPSNAFVAHRSGSSTPLHSAFVAHQSSSPQMTSQVHRDLTFTVAKDFTFPHPQVFKPVNVVLACRWVRELKQYLSSVDPTQPVTVTVASYDFAANLLNWLISAQVMTSPPLENILVISFDNALHKMLVRRRIPSVCVPYISVLRNPKSLGVHKVWMTRLAVIRLINHWGFDVQQFDTDAIILRNPQPVFDLFSGFDVVGSRAKLPFELGKGQWGFTVCMGVILFRSTRRTESLWKAMGKLRMSSSDDQYRLNFALLSTGLQWSSKELRIDKENTGVDKNGVQVVVLPPIYICRRLCVVNRTIDYYVWHEAGGGHHAWEKLWKNTQSKLWFLRKNWKTLEHTGKLMGRTWLESLSVSHSRSHSHL